jgi:hypothetical protein
MHHIRGMKTQEIIAKAGGPNSVARELGISHTSVLRWKRVPPKYAKRVAALSGVPLHEIWPELCDPPDERFAGFPGAIAVPLECIGLNDLVYVPIPK